MHATGNVYPRQVLKYKALKEKYLSTKDMPSKIFFKLVLEVYNYTLEQYF